MDRLSRCVQDSPRVRLLELTPADAAADVTSAPTVVRTAWRMRSVLPRPDASAVSTPAVPAGKESMDEVAPTTPDTSEPSDVDTVTKGAGAANDTMFSHEPGNATADTGAP